MGTEDHAKKTPGCRTWMVRYRVTNREIFLFCLLLIVCLFPPRSQLLFQSTTTATTTELFCYKTYYDHNNAQSSSSSSFKPVWHGGDPVKNGGSCWCGGGDGYCMCSPSVSVDVIVVQTSDRRGEDIDYGKIWLVRRKDTGQHATIGGFVNVGERAEDAAVREVLEETGIDLSKTLVDGTALTLLGVYSDPRRDPRRPNLSVAFLAIVNNDVTPRAGDDAKGLDYVSISEVPTLNMFSDHKSIVADYALRYNVIQNVNDIDNIDPGPNGVGGANKLSALRRQGHNKDSSALPFLRSTCIDKKTVFEKASNVKRTAQEGRLIKIVISSLDGKEGEEGEVVIQTRPSWAPLGVERFEELISSKFYDECRFFRVIPNFMAQIGIHGDPEVMSQWRGKSVQDDPVITSNARGTVSFATSGKNTRSTQIFINTGKKNAYLDGQGFAPFAEVLQGMEFVDRINSEYREKPSQGQIQQMGNSYLKQEFATLSYIKTARFID